MALVTPLSVFHLSYLFQVFLLISNLFQAVFKGQNRIGKTREQRTVEEKEREKNRVRETRVIKLEVQSRVWMEADGREGSGGTRLEDERKR